MIRECRRYSLVDVDAVPLVCNDFKQKWFLRGVAVSENIV